MIEMDVNPEIIRKANEIIRRKSEVRLCLDAGICPQCGGKVTHRDCGHGYTIVCDPCNLDLDDVC